MEKIDENDEPITEKGVNDKTISKSVKKARGILNMKSAKNGEQKTVTQQR